MKKKVEEALKRKVKEYNLVVGWFDYKYRNCREKQATELNAQIKMLRFLLDD